MENSPGLLRPNTFFLLLLRAGKPELGQSTGWAKSNGLTEPNLMADLLCVGCPDFTVKNMDTLGTYMSGFKSGNTRHANSKTYFPFSQPSYRASFAKTMEDDLNGALVRLEKLCNKYLDVDSGTNKELLIGGLMDLLQNSSCDYLFNLGTSEKTPSEFSSVKNISFYPFLLSVWYYVVKETPDSTEATTFDNNVGGATSMRINILLKYDHQDATTTAPVSSEEVHAESNDKVSDNYSEDACDSEVIEGPHVSEPNQAQVINQTINNWYNKEGGIQIAHIDKLEIKM